jgi:hypothetical protein
MAIKLLLFFVSACLICDLSFGQTFMKRDKFVGEWKLSAHWSIFDNKRVYETPEYEIIEFKNDSTFKWQMCYNKRKDKTFFAGIWKLTGSDRILVLHVAKINDTDVQKFNYYEGDENNNISLPLFKSMPNEFFIPEAGKNSEIGESMYKRIK